MCLSLNRNKIDLAKLSIFIDDIHFIDRPNLSLNGAMFKDLNHV